VITRHLCPDNKLSLENKLALAESGTDLLNPSAKTTNFISEAADRTSIENPSQFFSQIREIKNTGIFF